MKNKTVVIYSGGTDGGTGSLSIRITNWLLKHDYNVVFICNEINNINNARTLKEEGVKFYELKKLKEKFPDIFDVNTEYTFITYDLECFIKVESLRKNHKNIVNSYLYVVHPSALVKGTQLKSKLLHKISKKLTKILYGKMVLNFYNNNNILFMDEDCINQTENYLNIKLSESHNHIFRLPMIINDYQTTQLNIGHCKKKPFTILTIARLDFPFKGYIIGLLKDFYELRQKYDLKLVIIGDGSGMQNILNQLGKFDIEVKDSIEIIASVPYSKLESYFRLADVYIGMGTTLLDAVNNGVPAITANYFTYENTAIGFFYENPHILGTSNNKYKCKQLIESVINMKKEEYYRIVKHQRSQLIQLYDIESILTAIMRRENGDYRYYNNSLDVINYNSMRIMSKVFNFCKLISEKIK